MDWSANKDWLKWLAYTSGISCLVTSAIFVLVTVMPWFYFHRYLVGYYSPLDYRIHYGMTGKPVFMPCTDYIRHVTVTFLILSLLLLALSAISLALVNRKRATVAGALYGISGSLVVLNGLFFGYISRAISFDIDTFKPVMVDEVTVKTLAGTISYPGLTVEQTLIYQLVFNTPIVTVMLVIAVASSIVLVLLTIFKTQVEKLSSTLASITWKRLIPRFTQQLLPIATTSLVLLSSLFTYYPSSLTITPQPPPATFEPPPYAYTCAGLTRSRVAVAYTDFDPPVILWTRIGGTWYLASGVPGSTGYVLWGIDYNNGTGRASHLVYNADLTGYSSLWIATKTRHYNGSGWYGVVLGNTDFDRLYTFELSTAGYLTIHSFRVENSNGWSLLNSTTVPGYNSASWYVLVVNYTYASNTVSLHVGVYTLNGTLLASVTASSTSPRRFIPTYVGVTVDDVSAFFDDTVISTASPLSIQFTGLPAGLVVELWDNLGNLVNTTVTPTTPFTVKVTKDFVLGTGTNGRIVIKYPDASVCGVYTAPEAILGGDTYAFSTQSITLTRGVNKTSVNLAIYISGSEAFSTMARIIGINASQPLYARLILVNTSINSSLNLDIWLEGSTRSTNISIRDGLPVVNTTNSIQFHTGLNNWVGIAGFFTATGRSAKLSLRLELCTGPGGLGACVYYPINLSLYSTGTS